MLGPGPVSAHLAHAAGFWVAAEHPPARTPVRVVDLGSGAGLPGLVLAERWRTAVVVLVDSSARRAAFLRAAVAELGLPNVEVREDRAERMGRSPDWRGWADMVVARSFASPAVTAECAAPLLRTGGRFLVSEPPASATGRWPEAGLTTLGLAPVGVVALPSAHIAVFEQRVPCPERYPRRVGIPAKRPLF